MDSPGKPVASSPPSYDGLHRRQKPPLFAGVTPRPPFRVPPAEDLDPIESSTGMRRTASYSNFLSKKSNPFYKQTFQHTRTLSGQMNMSDPLTHTAGPSSATPPTASAVEDSMPTTLTKTPTYEYYGFVLYLVSGITYVMYLAWAYLPKEMLDSLGITYYPSKYWALALPIWLFVLVIYLYIVFFAVNLYNTASFDSFHTITDEHANPLETTSSAALTDDFVPDLMDIPIGLVNAALYQHIEGISDDEDEIDDELAYHWSATATAGTGTGFAGRAGSGGEDTLLIRTADGIDVEVEDDEDEFGDGYDDDEMDGEDDADEDEDEDEGRQGGRQRGGHDNEEEEEDEDEEREDDDEEEEEEGFKLDGTNLSDWDDFTHS